MATEGNGAKALLLEKGAMTLGQGRQPVFRRPRAVDRRRACRGLPASISMSCVARWTTRPTPCSTHSPKGIHENRAWIELARLQRRRREFQRALPEGLRRNLLPRIRRASARLQPWRASFQGRRIRPRDQFVNHAFANNDNITHKLNAPLTALVQDPSTKAVLGGVYTYEGKTVYVKANKGVIMTCGGFENNPQMRGDYLSGTTARCIAGRMNTGDGHYICSRIGADMWHMNSCAGFWTSVSPIEGEDVTMRTPKQFGITVAVNGRRFFMDWDSDHEHDWDVIDQNPLSINVGSRHGHMQFGGEWPHLPMPKTTWYILDDDGYKKMMAYETAPNFEPSSDGYGFRANSIAELAEAAGLPADELTRTVDLWNQYCEAGEDPRVPPPRMDAHAHQEGPVPCVPLLHDPAEHRRRPASQRARPASST